MNLEFFVTGRKLTRKGFAPLIADSAQCDTFTIEFDHEWDGLVKIVVLKNGSETVKVLYTGKTPLPRQVCGRGDLYLSCHGYREKGDTVAVVRTIPMVRPVRMVGCAVGTAETAQPYTPSAYEQMAAVIARAEAAAEHADRTARELLAMKESGQLRGPAGPAGQSATISVESVSRGETAKVENLGTERRAVLRFTLPYKDKLTAEEKQEMILNLKETVLDEIDTVLDEIIALQEAYMDQEVTR